MKLTDEELEEKRKEVATGVLFICPICKKEQGNGRLCDCPEGHRYKTPAVFGAEEVINLLDTIDSDRKRIGELEDGLLAIWDMTCHSLAVTRVEEYAPSEYVGLAGVVKSNKNGEITVEFPVKISGGHTCGGLCAEGQGRWFFDTEDLELITDDPTWTDCDGNTLRVGDEICLKKYPDTKGVVTENSTYGFNAFHFRVKGEKRETWDYGRSVRLINPKSKTYLVEMNGNINPKPNKEEVKMNMNENILEIYEKSEEAKLVNRYFGSHSGAGPFFRIFIQENKDAVLAEAKRLEKEELEA